MSQKLISITCVVLLWQHRWSHIIWYWCVRMELSRADRDVVQRSAQDGRLSHRTSPARGSYTTVYSSRPGGVDVDDAGAEEGCPSGTLPQLLSYADECSRSLPAPTR